MTHDKATTTTTTTATTTTTNNNNNNNNNNDNNNNLSVEMEALYIKSEQNKALWRTLEGMQQVMNIVELFPLYRG